MAYSTATPPQLLVQRTGGGYALWVYQSTDTAATVDTTGYITNGGQLGMKVGDLVLATATGTKITTVHYVVTVNATTGAVDLSDGTTIGSGTNTD